jgi:ABC-type bacteriocin/lantibiotic exporter with double-glycine peptidase domain
MLYSQVEDLVSKGWYAHFQFIAAAFDVVCSVILACWLNWKGVLPVAFLIPAISIVVQCRKSTLVKLLQERVQAELGWLEVMSDNMLNWRLVSAYQMNGQVCTQFKHTYEQFYKKHRKSRFYQTNCEWIPRFINELALAFVFVGGTMLCCDGQLTVGEFTALVSIFKRIGKKVLLLNRCVVRMIRSTVALHDLAQLLNMDTGINEQVRKTRMQHAH